MSKKTNSRAAYKEVGNQNRNYETLPDEITLRDEILELKRQVVVLRRANQQYLVKLRKYEDEAKRKDKQMEQLMDPRKNADLTRVLSTKGAAILMNLKDQNNTLIQMILNKDLHIRRLVAEIKMSKLYASTRKNESYRAEINRLRNLQIKSQEALKENVDVQQERSICASGNSLLEFSSSSDQSSPRDLDELRVTILSLESHIQHSNNLLAKKNQEISSLANEVNFLRKCFRYNPCKNKTFDCDTTTSKNQRFSTTDLTHKWVEPLTPTKVSTQKVDLLEKNQDDKKLPHSAPAISTASSTESTPKYRFQSHTAGQKQNPMEKNRESADIMKTNHESFEEVSVVEKLLFPNLATKELLIEKEILSNLKTICAKEKWMKALNKCRESKKLKPQISTACGQSEDGNKPEETVTPTEFLNGEAKRGIQIEPQELPQESDSLEPFKKELKESVFSVTSISFNIAVNDNETLKMCQNSESSLALNKNIVSNDEKQHTERETQSKERKHSTETVNGVTETVHDETCTEELETNKRISPRGIYRKSMDSSFESESSCSMKKEVEVQVQIDSVSLQNDSDQSLSSIPETNLIFKYERENDGNRAPDLDFNDDDDVIVRKK